MRAACIASMPAMRLKSALAQFGNLVESLRHESVYFQFCDSHGTVEFDAFIDLVFVHGESVFPHGDVNNASLENPKGRGQNLGIDRPDSHRMDRRRVVNHLAMLPAIEASVRGFMLPVVIVGNAFADFGRTQS